MKSQIKLQKARKRLRDFVDLAWPIVEPAYELVPNWHIDAICDHLQAVAERKIRKLLINVPPGMAKSMLVSVLFPAWMWIVNPAWRSIFGSYSGPLATRDSMKTRRIIESPWYMQNFAKPEYNEKGELVSGWTLADDQNKQHDFQNTKSGRRLAISVTGKATGERGNAVIFDDPLNAMDAYSAAEREKAITWWDKAMPSRVDKPKEAAFIGIMQRLHEDDLSGHILSKELGYQHLCLPAEFERKRKSITYINTGEKFWEDPRTEEGELIFEEMFPKEFLESQEKTLGSMAYAGQYQQRPEEAGGNMFKIAHWRFWKPDGLGAEKYPRPDECWEGPAVPLPKLGQIIISVDAAFKDGKKNDYVCFLVVGVSGANRFILDRRHDHMSFTKTLAVFKELCAKWPTAFTKLVEDKANGSAVIDSLKGEIGGIIAINPEGGKESRAAAAQPQVESGNVYLPEGAPWLDSFIAELAKFPKGKHDDQVDAFTQVLNYLTVSPDVGRLIALSTM